MCKCTYPHIHSYGYTPKYRIHLSVSDFMFSPSKSFTSAKVIHIQAYIYKDAAANIKYSYISREKVNILKAHFDIHYNANILDTRKHARTHTHTHMHTITRHRPWRLCLCTHTDRQTHTHTHTHTHTRRTHTDNFSFSLIQLKRIYMHTTLYSCNSL